MPPTTPATWPSACAISALTSYEGIDLPRDKALTLVQQFSRQLRQGDTALFFFAGHGIQMGRSNFIMPVDAQPGDEETLTQSSIKLQSILTSMEDRADTRIIILDACRNNPFLKASTSRSGGTTRGFMRMDAGVGSFIAFSTEPGNVASDGNGRNSPFTAALLRHIGTPGADIHAVMRRVRAEVKDSSNNLQIPWEKLLADQRGLPCRSARPPDQYPDPATATDLQPTAPIPAPADLSGTPRFQPYGLGPRSQWRRVSGPARRHLFRGPADRPHGRRHPPQCAGPGRQMVFRANRNRASGLGPFQLDRPAGRRRTAPVQPARHPVVRPNSGISATPISPPTAIALPRPGAAPPFPIPIASVA